MRPAEPGGALQAAAGDTPQMFQGPGKRPRRPTAWSLRKPDLALATTVNTPKTSPRNCRQEDWHPSLLGVKQQATSFPSFSQSPIPYTRYPDVLTTCIPLLEAETSASFAFQHGAAPRPFFHFFPFSSIQLSARRREQHHLFLSTLSPSSAPLSDWSTPILAWPTPHLLLHLLLHLLHLTTQRSPRWTLMLPPSLSPYECGRLLYERRPSCELSFPAHAACCVLCAELTHVVCSAVSGTTTAPSSSATGRWPQHPPPSCTNGASGQ